MNEQDNDRFRRADNRVRAAALVLEACFSEYIAALRVGSPKERQNKFDAVISSYEGFLDAHSNRMHWELVLSGIDPNTRHFNS